MLPFTILALTFTAIALFTVGHAHAGSGSVGPIDTKQESVAKWLPAVLPLSTQYGIPVGFALAWIAVESAGKVCAYGNAQAKGPDGFPKEMGLFQLYNPDDLARFKTTGAELRAYCKPGTQEQSRSLTGTEIVRHVDLGMQLIAHCKEQAFAYMLKSGVVEWSNRDKWRMVKLWHALPVIVSHGIAEVTSKLGRAPGSWDDFRATFVHLHPEAANVQNSYWRALENAEKTGEHVDG